MYPVIDKQQCSDCGLCNRVCPTINRQPAQHPITTYAATNSNQAIREQSSSGGIFTLFAEETIKKGGIVFGAAFNKDWEVEHTFIDNADDLYRLRGSKYVQSRMGNCYAIAEKFLQEGKEVLFCGTPCQIAGLKRFLRKEYNNLKAIDIACHGTPSPWIWKIYLDEICHANGISNIRDIQFRDKTKGWKRYSFVIKYNGNNGQECEFREAMDNNIFMKSFLSDLCLRPSCHSCPARCGKSGSDITIADLWGAQHICPEIDDDRGLSLVIVRKDGKIPQCDMRAIPYNEALKYNPSLEYDSRERKRRSRFFRSAKREGVCKATVQCTTKSSLSMFWKKVKELF